MTVNIGQFNSPVFYNYTYDQLNRITAMDTWTGLNEASNSWSGLAKQQQYKERVAYDANGNILAYLRNGISGNLTMDSLSYQYNRDGSGNLLNNRLNYVRDRVGGSTAHDGNYAEDIDDQAANNYSYDAIGNLTGDTKEGILTGNITWTVYGKIATITKTVSSVTTNISYTYDAGGNRISKTVNGKTTWYVRDASGNVMSVYEVGNSQINSGELTQTEAHLFGSSRLGVFNMTRNVQNPVSNNTGIYTFTRGYKFFELSNHLGNVLVTISDKKLGHDGGSGVVDYFLADVVTANDYYPFGMGMPGRKYVSGSLYRYGFNGKEQDSEISGTGTQYDYGFRIYNPRISRFLSVDPKTASFPFYTPYQFAGNKPINSIDLDGLEDVHYIFTWTKDNAVIGLHSWREGNVTGHDRNGVEIFDRPYKIYAHYPVHYGDDTYFVTATYDSYEAYKQAKGSDFTGSTILLGTLLGFQAADDMMDKVQMMLGIGAAKGAFKRWFKSKTDELAQWGLKQGDNAAEGILKEGVEGQLDEVTEVAAKKVIGATGDVGENYLKKLGGQSQVYFNTTKGARYVDQLVNGVAHESKVGYTTLTRKVRKQIAKDAELLKTGKVKEVMWSFFESPVTGKAGASKPLQEALDKAGIKTQIIRNIQ
jgi:RHS repeat-associated protein